MHEASSGDKQVATLQAVAALSGIRVDPIDNGAGGTAYILTRWNLTKQCNTLDDLRRLLRRMGIKT